MQLPKSIVLKSTFTFRLLFFILVLSGFILPSFCQVSPPPGAAAPGNDTLRIIQIVKGDRLREKEIDAATTIQTIAGNVFLIEGLTKFYCDSAVINKRTNILEAYGNIHINQSDSIHTYAQTLKYTGNDRIAHLTKDVKLTDNKGTLYTQVLDYDLKSSIGNYSGGGRVVNGKTILTSTEGVYYAETKDVYFKKNVHLVDPKYDIRNDTLLYNTQTQISSWNTPTVIKSKNGGDIYSSSGTYDLKNGKAYFGNRTVIKDSSRTYVADNSAYDEKSGIAQLEGNAIIKDSVNGYTVLGGQIYLDKNDNSFLATRKPVLIFKGDGNDSTFIAADTLFSGVQKRDKNGNLIAIKQDTIRSATLVEANDSAIVLSELSDTGSLRRTALTDSTRPARLKNFLTDSMALSKGILPVDTMHVNKPLPQKDSTGIAGIIIPPDSLLAVVSPVSGSLEIIDNRKDSSITNELVAKDSLIGKDSLSMAKAASDTAVRYFIAFHNVRIFNDSLQSVCDSLFYTAEDSIFRLFQNPLVFSNKSQIAGDTIYMYTKNKKPERLYVFENGIIINKANEKMYNQIGGRTLNGYFKDGTLDYMRAKGSPAESVFYPQDDDSAYIGMNRSKGDVIDIYFVDKAVNKVKFINDVDGTLFPLRQIPEDQKYLRNYKWEDKRRPKSKLELFE